MVALAGDFQVPASGGSTGSASGGRASTASQACDHRCTVITLSIAIPLLSLFLIALLTLGLLQRRREKRANKSKKDEEKEISMRKLGPESEASIVITESFGDFRAVTSLEEGAEVVRDEEGFSKSWRAGKWGSKTRGWWKL